MLENIRSKKYYKFVGVLSYIVAPVIIYNDIWAHNPHGFASLGAGILFVLLALVLFLIYLLFFIVALCDHKRLVSESINKYIDIGFILGFFTIIYYAVCYLIPPMISLISVHLQNNLLN